MSREDSKPGSEAAGDALEHLKVEDASPDTSLHINDATIAPDIGETAHVPWPHHGGSLPTPQSAVPSIGNLKTDESLRPKDEVEQILDAEVTIKLEDGKPKLSRKASQKVIPQEAEMFNHLPDCTPEAISHFQVIPHCLYGTKNMGLSDHDALGCDCSPEFCRFLML